MSSDNGFDLSLEVDLQSLDRVRDYIDRTGRRLGVDEGNLADLRLVVDEAVTNIVVHGYAGRGGLVELHMEARGGDLLISIRDEAASFDADAVAPPQLDTGLADRPFGGMGIYLIRQMTDEAVFETRPDGGNELRLLKRGVIAENG